MFSRDFYASQRERLRIDSGFVAQGYFDAVLQPSDKVAEAHDRIAMQQALGLDVRWVDSDEFDEMNPAMATGMTLGGSYAADDGYIDPPSNVLAYTAALFARRGARSSSVPAFTGLHLDGDRVRRRGDQRGRHRD